MESLPKAETLVLREHGSLSSGGVWKGEGKYLVRRLLAGAQGVHRECVAKRKEGLQARFLILP